MEELFGQKNVKLAFTKKSLDISILVQTAVKENTIFLRYKDDGQDEEADQDDVSMAINYDTIDHQDEDEPIQT